MNKSNGEFSQGVSPSYQRIDPSSSVAIFKGDPRVKEPDIDSWLRELLGDYKDKSRSDQRPHLYGSDAGFCARRNVLVEHNNLIETLSNSAGNAFMSIGYALENLLADALIRKGRLLAQNQYLVPMDRLKIAGKVDFYIFDQDDRLAAIECKSCGELPLDPKPGHLAQIQTYSAVNGVDTCYLTYVSRKITWKQPLNIRTFIVDTSEAALTERLRIAALSRLTSDAHRLSPVPAHFRKHTECHYCEFRDYFCYAQRPGQGGQLPLLPSDLQELSLEELVNFDLQAQSLAAALMFERPERLKTTLIELWENRDKFSKDLRPLFREEFRKAKEAAEK